MFTYSSIKICPILDLDSFIKMPGVNKRVIVSSTHLLVVERSYLLYNTI